MLVISVGTEHWETLPPMHEPRSNFVCEAFAGNIIVAGGDYHKSAEVYDEVLGRWLRLPHDLPGVGGMDAMGSAFL